MIFCDPRFGSERKGQRSSHRLVPEALSALGVATELTHLDSGDFAFFGNGPDGPIQVGVELKVVSDLVTSMRSGRLAEQVLGMSEQYQRSYLIVEGFYRARRGSGLLEVPRGRRWQPLMAGPRPVFWADVEKFFTGLEEAGVRVRRTRTTNETARVIAHVLQGFWAKDYEDHKSLQTGLSAAPPLALVREDETTLRVRRVAKALGVGIGWARSKAVVEQFGSVLTLAEASADEWEAVEGIGKNIARDAYKAVRDQAVSTSPRVPARVVPTRPRAAYRGTRSPQQRQNNRMDASRRVERSVPPARTSRRKFSRSQP